MPNELHEEIGRLSHQLSTCTNEEVRERLTLKLVAASKRDAVAAEDPLPALRQEAGRLGLDVFPVSAVTRDGLLELERALAIRVAEARAEAAASVEQGEVP